jgi:hypothetical protein
MNRILLLLLAGLLWSGAAFADPEDGYRGGPGWGRGPGMMGGGPGWGMGPGMMGGGPGWGGMMGGGPGMMWGEGWDLDEYAQIPADKRAKLRDLSVETQRKLVGQMAAMHELMLTQWRALSQFPVDRAQATKAWEGLNLLHKQMFEAQLDATAKAQEILGKDLWEKLGGQDGLRRGPRGRPQ